MKLNMSRQAVSIPAASRFPIARLCLSLAKQSLKGIRCESPKSPDTFGGKRSTLEGPIKDRGKYSPEVRMRSTSHADPVAVPAAYGTFLCSGLFASAGQQSQPAQGQQSQQQGQSAQAGGQSKNQVLGPAGEVWGFTNLAEIPGTPWRIHDANRPQPRVVTPEPGWARSAVGCNRAF